MLQLSASLRLVGRDQAAAMSMAMSSRLVSCPSDLNLPRFALLGFFSERLSLENTSRASSSRAIATHAAVAKGAQRTSWDEAADVFFSEAGEKKGLEDGGDSRRDVQREDRAGQNVRSRQEKRQPGPSGEKEAFGRRSASRSEGPRSKEGSELSGRSEGVKRWVSTVDRERKDFGGRLGTYEGVRTGKARQWQNQEFGSRERRSFDSTPRFGGEKKYGAENWQRSSRARDDGQYTRQSGSGSHSKSGNEGFVRRSGGWDEGEREPDERVGFRDERRWQSREQSPPLEVEGQVVYGVAPIISAFQASRRTFYTLYMQENLLQNVEKGKRKDKAAVSFIEKTARSLGLAVKEASKHDLNMLVDNRPHQGLVLDASPLEMVPVDMLEQPLYQESKTPMWVALDEVNDPQNFGAILRSAYFLGAEGVIVCAKNSAPLSGVVSKASAGAMEVMEVQFCKNMMKFLDKSRENGWRIVGASPGPASVPVQELPRGIATILVLGNEGRGMRTNVKRACDQLVSIAGISNGRHQQKITDFVTEDSQDAGLDIEEEDEEDGDGVRSGAEVSLLSGPLAVDSLNVSVAAGIMLYELMGRPIEERVASTSSC